jgi:methionyl-tRNA formyltransferase
MKVAFMGSDPIALPMLDELFHRKPAGCELDVIFTQPDRRHGRGMRLKPNAIKEWALENGIDVEQPGKCGEAEARLLADREIDLILVMAYGQILPKCILGCAPAGILNVHASILPRLRGASPIHTAVALGLPETGVSLMEIVPKLDAGPVSDLERIPIGKDDTVSEVIQAMSKSTVSLVRRGLERLGKGTLEFVEQDPEQVTYCRILEKTDRHLDFNEDATVLHNRIRAFQPWPGTSFPYGDMEIRIHAARVDRSSSDGIAPGMIDNGDEGLRIACGEGWIVPLKLQRPGGKPLAVEDFLRGFPLEHGRTLESRPMRPLEADRPFPYKRK